MSYEQIMDLTVPLRAPGQRSSSPRQDPGRDRPALGLSTTHTPASPSPPSSTPTPSPRPASPSTPSPSASPWARPTAAAPHATSWNSPASSTGTPPSNGPSWSPPARSSRPSARKKTDPRLNRASARALVRTHPVRMARQCRLGRPRQALRPRPQLGRPRRRPRAAPSLGLVNADAHPSPPSTDSPPSARPFSTAELHGPTEPPAGHARAIRN